MCLAHLLGSLGTDPTPYVERHAADRRQDVCRRLQMALVLPLPLPLLLPLLLLLVLLDLLPTGFALRLPAVSVTDDIRWQSLQLIPCPSC